MENIVKRRGRKKKEPVPVDETEHVKIKRGRKAKVIEFKKNTKLVEFDLDEPCILKLPINLEKLLESTPYRLGVETILMGRPSDPVPINSEYYSREKGKSTKDVKKSTTDSSLPQVYNCVDKKGNPDKITIFETSPLSFKVDSEGEKRVELRKTDVACWWCCHKFDTYPICCPLKYESKKDTFKVVGVFCSFNCAKAYSSFEYGYESSSLISYLQKRLKKQFKNVKKAPPKSVLTMFGGPLSIEEYRETFDTLCTISINISPMVFLPIQIEHHKVCDKKSSRCLPKELSEKTVAKANERLSLSLKKSVKNNDNTLMDIMGIKIKENH